MMFTKSIIAASAFAAAVAKTIPVDVGKNGLTFTPNITSAAPGDVLQFSFYPKNHSATSGPFDDPCQVGSLTPSFFSGFVPTLGESPTTFSVTVNSTDPIWIFCNVGQHCQLGMVMVVNQPEGANSLAAYAAAATKTKNSEIPFGGKPMGGTISTRSNGTSNTSSPSGTVSSPSGTASSPSGTGSSPFGTSSPIAPAISAAKAISVYAMSAAGSALIGAMVFAMAL